VSNLATFVASPPKAYTPTTVVDYVLHRGSGSDEPKPLYKNFRDLLPETLDNIRNLLTWPERWDGYDAPKPNPASVEHARSWAEDLYRDVRAELWIKPHVTADEEGDVVFEWWKGRKKLTVYISPETTEYIKVNRLDTGPDMQDGSVQTPQERRVLWNWLLS
jgi:hypothetical protein